MQRIEVDRIAFFGVPKTEGMLERVRHNLGLKGTTVSTFVGEESPAEVAKFLHEHRGVIVAVAANSPGIEELRSLATRSFQVIEIDHMDDQGFTIHTVEPMDS